MARFKISPKLLIGIIVAVFFGVSLLFRIYLPYEKIFVGEWIKYSGTDAYFYTRLVDNMVHNFPHLTQFNPFFIYPGGGAVGSLSFFHWLQACFTWIVGLGSPTQHTVDVVGVYFPAILGALVVIPVYFIGKTLFNKWVGVLAAGLAAVLPGEFLGRSILGAGDTPVAETLFTTTALVFLILAIKTAGQRQLTFKNLIERDWKVITRPLVYSLLAGIFLGMYLITWLGALLFVFIIILYFLIQFIINHLRARSSDHLTIIGFILFLVALIIFVPTTSATYLSFAMIVAVLIPLGLCGISLLISSRGLKPYYYPIALVVAAVVFAGIFYVVTPGSFSVLLRNFNFVFFPLGSTATTTIEMQPLLNPQGDFTAMYAWGNFTTGFFIAPWWLIPGLGFAAICGYIYHLNKQGSNGKPLLLFLVLSAVILIIVAVTQYSSGYSLDVKFIPGVALISFSILTYLLVRGQNEGQRWQTSLVWVLVILMLLVMLIILVTYREARYFAILPFALLIYLFFKQRGDDEHRLFFLFWTLLILIVAMIQRRFCYYLVINIALLSAYLSWQVIWLSGLRKLASKPGQIKEEVTAEPDKFKTKKKHEEGRSLTVYYVNTALAVIVVFVFVFFFNIIYSKNSAPQVTYAPSDAWQASLLWMKDNTPEPMGEPDAYYRLYEAPPLGEEFEYPESAYGVTSWWDYGYWISRIAHRIPSANPSQEAGPIRKVANLFLSREEPAARDVMTELDSSYIILDYATCTSKYWAVADWNGEELDKYIGTYYIPYEGQLVPLQLFHSEYYHSLCVRLYNFDGEAVPAGKITVVSYQDKVDQQGNNYRQATDIQEFESSQEAVAYMESDKSVEHRIAGIHPFISPISLEAVEDYRLIYSSEFGRTDSTVGLIPEVKIFEYIPQE